MSMGYRKSSWGLAFVTLLSPACGDDSAEPPDPGPPSDRSADCQSVQNAACDRAQRCGAIDRATCLADLRTTYCTSDEAARSCADTVSSLACTSAAPCLEQIFDRERPQAECNQFIEAVCDWTVRCDSTTTRDACLTEVRETVDCTRAVGVGLTRDECFDALEEISCEATSLPSACLGLIKADSG